MCRAHGIELWGIRDNGEKYICSMYADDFVKIKPIAKKTRTKVHVLKKRGLPFILRKLKRYFPLIILLVMAFCLLIYSNNFVWSIEYVGNLQISDDEMGDFITGEGIHYGIKKKAVDCDSVEKDIRKSFGNVIWTSVYFEGTKLFVNVKENDTPSVKVEEDGGADIVSDEDGVVVSMLVRNGVPLVKAGDEVVKGQVLVSGSVPIYNDDGEAVDYQLYRADGDILLQTQYEYKNTLNMTYPVINYTGGGTKSRFVQIWGYEFSSLEINKFFKEKRNMRYETTIHKSQLRLPLICSGNFYLPAYYGEIDRKEYYIQYRTYTEEEAKLKLTEDFEKNISSLEEKGIKIVEKSFKMVQNRNDMELIANLVIIKKSGVSNPLEIN
jgi:similar to stage IV sporulation protein